jgi:hypothetical protein
MLKEITAQRVYKSLDFKGADNKNKTVNVKLFLKSAQYFFFSDYYIRQWNFFFPPGHMEFHVFSHLNLWFWFYINLCFINLFSKV